jgi:hypothetical protein
MEWLSTGIFKFVEFLENITTRSNMKTLIVILLIIFAVSYWSEFSNFVSGNLSGIGDATAKWLVEHTPKK